ncbi:MAG: LysM peptidoglycan-binding domain-containing protein, partial [Anaerolineales bacterium]|nr:LysM peptidoglycan-binding domain-containing protein [Anaerolineales bacterium]
RAGGQYYRQCWSGAASSGSDMVIITSFNEWQEGSQIEPGASYGSFYLDLTAELAAAFKAGSAISGGSSIAFEPAAEPVVVSSPEPTATAGPSLTPSITPMPSMTPTSSSTPTPKPSPTALPDGSIVHRVEEGDTLLWISEQYSMTLETLIALNGLDPEDILWIGQPLVVDVIIPTSTSIPTTVTSKPTAIRQVTDSITPTIMADHEQVGENGLKIDATVEGGQAEPVVVVPAPTLLSSPDGSEPVSKIQVANEHTERGLSGSLYVMAVIPVLFLAFVLWLLVRVRQSPRE